MDQNFSHLLVEFYTEPVHNVRESAEKGRPIFDDVEMVRIRAAGDKLTVFTAPAKDASSARDPNTNARLTYAQLHHGPYEAFKRGQEFHGSGTPLSEVPFITAGKRKELQAANIHTAEAFIAVDGSSLQKLGMGARELRDQVKAWIDKTSKNADVVKLSQENEDLRARLERMEQLMDKATSPDADPYDASASPFSEWDDETIRVWIVEQGGEQPHHKCSHETLVRKADELNSTLSKTKAA
jgi:hypothetical protein|uniref:Uncharacterized protein n=1 Tax=viral metagenome TaxID=1070528 RepID=A0A6H1ZAY8_9ZZZZ